MVRVTVWNEYRSEGKHERGRELYPDGIHAVLAGHFEKRGHDVRTATLDQDPEHGLTEDVLAGTDVLVWLGHEAHDEVLDEVVERVHDRVLDGMGLLVLHSAILAKPFVRLMGTTGRIKWRDVTITDGERERLWVIDPGHPIAAGLEREYVEIPQAEMYGEPADIPSPDELVFVGWFEGGEVFRSGCCYRRGKGRVFYFQPGHETFPVYHHDEITTILGNAVEWAAPGDGPARRFEDVREPIEEIEPGTPSERQ